MSWDPWKDAAAAGKGDGKGSAKGGKGERQSAAPRMNQAPVTEEVPVYDMSTPRGLKQESTWQKYKDPETDRAWFYDSETGDYFFEDVAKESGWTKYGSDHGPWWHHEEKQKWFFETAAGASAKKTGRPF